MGKGEGRLLLDLGDVVSALLARGHVAGPQRVALEIALAMRNLSAHAVPVVYSRLWKRYVEVDLGRLVERDTAYLRHAGQGRDGLFKRLRALPDLQRAVRPGPGDRLAILGAGWTGARRNRLRQHRQPGVPKVIWFCHDLAPILQPELAAGIAEDRHLFRRWLERGLDLGDLFLCASAFVADGLDAYARQRGKRPHLRLLPLAHEFRAPDGELRPAIGLLRGQRTVLCVGALSARKNQMALVRLWQALHADFGEALPVLVLAGDVEDGGRIGDVVAGGSPWTRKIALLRRATDAELAELYRHCDFTILSGLHEGWGLPAGESLWMGRPCLSANAGGLPEAGGGHTVLFEAGDAAALEKAARRALAGDFSARPPAREKLRRWEDVARDLLGLLHPA
jgi:glycosyltransferase involved in cell wall biosynthesis